MIVSITLHTAIEQTLSIPEFDKNRTLRATSIVQNIGGVIGTASWILGHAGIGCTAFGFKAGTLGNLVEEILHSQSVDTNFISVDGSSCLNTLVVSSENDDWSTISTSTLDITPAHLDQLTAMVRDNLPQITSLILGDKVTEAIQAECLADIIQVTRERGITTIGYADATNISTMLSASPTYLLLDQETLTGLVGHQLETLGAILEAAQRLVEQYETQLILLSDEHGVLAMLAAGTYHNQQLDMARLKPRKHAVLGSLTAGIARTMASDMSPVDGLKHGLAYARTLSKLDLTSEYNLLQSDDMLKQVEVTIL